MTQAGVPSPEDLAGYAGRWVAVLGGRVVGQGGTPAQAMQMAQTARHKENPQIMYVPLHQSPFFNPVIEMVRALLPDDLQVYLVGGAVRDALRGEHSHDLDFVVAGSGLEFGRRVANALGGAYYPLGEEFDTGRVILQTPAESRLLLDFSRLRGADLQADLAGRDFTLNAIAVDIRQPDALLDPLGGAADLQAGRLRACAPEAFRMDPLRIIRGVRLAAAHGYHIVPDTRKLMKQAVGALKQVSPERIRDEFLRLLSGPQPGVAVRALDMLGVWQELMPELITMKGVAQTAPHIFDVWEHTLNTLARLEDVLQALGPRYDPDQSANQLALGLAVLRLGRYRQQIEAQLKQPFTPERRGLPILFLAALLHDVGKPLTRSQEADGRIRFFGHEESGAQIAARIGNQLRLSADENHRLKLIVRHHMRPLLLGHGGEIPTRRAIYRFFRDTGAAGVDVCLLSLADFLATFGPTLPQDEWAHHLEVVRNLLEAYWEHGDEQISPVLFLDGRELIEIFKLTPGPKIGELLAALREAQATGEIENRQAALEFIHSKLAE